MSEPSSHTFTDRTRRLRRQPWYRAGDRAGRRRGANVVLLAKTAEPHPKLPAPSTPPSPRSRPQAARASRWSATCATRRTCNAPSTPRSSTSAASTSRQQRQRHRHRTDRELAAKKFDLMMDINVRGTFLLTKAALHLRQVANAHVLTLAPPMNMNPYWLGAHPSYTLSKYGMTLLSLGWAAEYADRASASPACGRRPTSRRRRWPTSPTATSWPPARGSADHG